MIGLLLITHDQLGNALVATSTHVLGKTPEQVSVIEVGAGSDPRDLTPMARSRVAQLNTGDGVLVMTDVFGASPANLACKLVEPGTIEAVAGVNVPMILRALSSRTQGMPHLLKRVVGGGCEGVFRIECSGRDGPRVSDTLAGQLKPTSASAT
jgi:mannose PTS system EIIA component